MTNVKLLVHQWQMSKEGTFSLYRSVPKKNLSQVNQSNPSNMEPRICKLNKPLVHKNKTN